MAEGGESAMFKQLFPSWKEKDQIKGLGNTHTVGKIGDKFYACYKYFLNILLIHLKQFGSLEVQFCWINNDWKMSLNWWTKLNFSKLMSVKMFSTAGKIFIARTLLTEPHFKNVNYCFKCVYICKRDKYLDLFSNTNIWEISLTFNLRMLTLNSDLLKKFQHLFQNCSILRWKSEFYVRFLSFILKF